MEIQRIPREGVHARYLRDQKTLVVEVEGSVNTSFDGRFLPLKSKGSMQVEIYEDRLPALMQRVETASDRQAFESATSIWRNNFEEWKSSSVRHQRMTEEEALRIYNQRPENFLRYVDRTRYKRGYPPIRGAKVVSKDGESMDVFKFAGLSDAKKRAFVRDAPPTPENSAKRANDNLADAIVRGNQALVEAVATTVEQRLSKLNK